LLLGHSSTPYGGKDLLRCRPTGTLSKPESLDFPSTEHQVALPGGAIILRRLPSSVSEMATKVHSSNPTFKLEATCHFNFFHFFLFSLILLRLLQAPPLEKYVKKGSPFLS
jgi:hypothetical protein